MIGFEVLGQPGGDNALLVLVDNRHGRCRLLFDCGHAVLDAVPAGTVLDIDHLCFSHLHIDHVAGFDQFLRVNLERPSGRNRIWGPPETARILQHRLQGFMWNHAATLESDWLIQDIGDETITAARFVGHEAFAIRHQEPSRAHEGPVLDEPGFTLEALALDHHTPSLGYIIREKPSLAVDKAALAAFGVEAGRWLGLVKSKTSGTVLIDDRRHDIAALRERLLVPAPQQALAFLTDFRLDATTHARLLPRLAGIDWLICESQYAGADSALAERHHHATVTQVASLAHDADVGALVLVHLSRRYGPQAWQAMLAEARAIFPRARFADHWTIPEAWTVPTSR